MSVETLMAAARAVADPLALLFLIGSLTMLWALWKVLTTDIDLTDDGEKEREDETADRPSPPKRQVAGGKV